MIIKLPPRYNEESLTAKPPSNGPAYPDGYLPDYLYSEAGVGHIPTRYPGKSAAAARAELWAFRVTWAALIFVAGFLAGATAALAVMMGWV